MADQKSLFDAPPARSRPAPAGNPTNLIAEVVFPHWFKLSPKMPTRFASNAAAGRHPHGWQLLDKPEKCGKSCCFSTMTRGAGLRCDVAGGRGWDSHGDRSVRSTWMACEKWESNR